MVIADKSYDADAMVQAIRVDGAQAVIPARSNRRDPRRFDARWHRDRNLIERFVNGFKQFRRVGTGYEEFPRSYLSFLHLVCAFVWLT